MKQYKTLKTVLCVLLTVFIIYSSSAAGFSVYASAERVYYIADTYYTSEPENIQTKATVIPLEEYLRSELIKCSEVIDIRAYNISTDKINDVASLIYDNIPEAFHVYRFGYSYNSQQITTLRPVYNCTAAEYAVMYNECLEATEKILFGIKDNSMLTDVQKALLLHDSLALLCEYDYENYLLDTLPEESYSMYGALIKGTAVCQGYAEAYLYLLREVGIYSYLCESSALYHAWNIVEINGEEYHVDVTWDDPVYDVTGKVLHKNFLRSSDGIYETGHNANDYITTPSSTKYDSFFWQNSEAAFCLADEEIYYIDKTDSYIKRYSDKSEVKSVSDMWMSGPNSYYPGCYARLSSDGKNLFYNNSQSVFELNPETGETQRLWTPEAENEYFRIYGFKYQDNYLFCDINQTPNFNLTTKADYQQKMFYLSEANTVPTGISINTYPDAVIYDIGDTFSSDGLSLLVSYNNGTSAVITDGFTLSDIDTSKEGEKTVRVSYKGFSAEFTITVLCKHKNISNIPAEGSTCIKQGHGAYTRCTVCSRIISGSDSLLPLDDHKYTSAVTSPPTCTAVGERTFTCEVCLDSYTEAIPKTAHSYTASVTNPTCTQKGFTTYTCKCSDSYISDYTDKTGHSHTSEITTPATHTTAGVMTYTCHCGDSYTESIDKLPDHTYNAVTIEPDCIGKGYTEYSCACGDSYTSDFINEASHKDSDNNYFCDYCGKNVGTDASNPCAHICHKEGFMHLVWKIISHFLQRFGVNPVCECGAAHY